ncbi:ParB/RepB/Spo0J family partition protein [Rhodocytophaga rosea]|uniref:ParB/RepB/Spo0J family partition protein n=1 Tax=Rhodocytophaga rosea TaxID=2704465 RepID=A0A6C0GM47_9BACT|nr:ParB/RepB/Spo0J family partition protein [Rhodocytophaga rosea]QHT68703.1 ParB/RepB/Spo0J family partition protein [Rhodocytophaga rosea]
MKIDEVHEINLDQIKLQGINVRSDLSSSTSQESLKELAESIKEHGLMQPIILRGKLGSPLYDVVVGQRRFLAHQLLGEKTIKATFTGDIDDIHALMLSLSENLHRAELSYKDTEKAITTLYKHYGKDANKVAKELGFSVRKVRSFIKIDEQATEKIKNFLYAGQISAIDAKRALEAAQGDPTKADQLIDKIKDLTKYEKRRVVEFGQKNPNAQVQEILEGAEKARIEETVILNLPIKVGKALKKASDDLAIESDVITLNALTDWLKNNNYLNE